MQPTEAFDNLAEATILDVREWYEWVSGTVEGAIHIPIRQLSERIDDVPRERPVIVVCQVGQRSALAAEFLSSRGYDAHNLEGGLESWVAQGFPLVDGAGESGDVVEGWAQRQEL